MSKIRMKRYISFVLMSTCLGLQAINFFFVHTTFLAFLVLALLLKIYVEFWKVSWRKEFYLEEDDSRKD